VRHRTSETRLDNFFSWFAASVLVTAGIIYGLKLQDDRHQRPHAPVLPPRATPAQEPLTLQQLRAVERGRGRGARTPSQIPWRGWKDVILRTYRRIQDNRVLAVAAGVAFYSLVALFPAIAAGVSSYALFANVATISKHLSIASDIIPAGSLDLLSAEITRIAAKSDGKLTFGFLLGLGIALWSSNAGMKAIFDASISSTMKTRSAASSGSMWCRCSSPSAPLPRSGWRSRWWWCFRCLWPHSASPASTIRLSAICVGR